MSSALSHKTALITGSTSGIGLGIARELARAEVHVMLHGSGDPVEIGRIRQELPRLSPPPYPASGLLLI